MLMNSNNMLCWKTIGICNRVSSLCEYAKLNISNGQKLEATKFKICIFGVRTFLWRKQLVFLKSQWKT
jgi:hypothetical protein